MYLGLIGDRSIKDNEFGKIQKDREQEMKYWSTKFRTVQKDEKDIKVGIVAANNPYAGFGATTANMIRVMNNLPSIEWGMDKDIDYIVELHATNGRELKSKQKTLFDYPTT